MDVRLPFLSKEKVRAPSWVVRPKRRQRPAYSAGRALKTRANM